jgi:hypothetical protein
MRKAVIDIVSPQLSPITNDCAVSEIVVSDKDSGSVQIVVQTLPGVQVSKGRNNVNGENLPFFPACKAVDVTFLLNNGSTNMRKNVISLIPRQR